MNERPEWADDLERKIDALASAVESMQEMHKQILEIASRIKDEVSPILSKLESNPMLKMFLGGK